MNGKNGGKLRFSAIGTHAAKLLASPMDGPYETPSSGIRPMTYANTNFRNAIVSVAGALLFSSLFLASVVGPAMTAVSA